MNEHQCVNCGAVLPPTGTYCLACDTPVAEPQSGLSVGQTQVVQHGRPLLAGALVLAGILVLGAIGFGIRQLLVNHTNGTASTAAITALTYLVHAEGGHAGACPYAEKMIVGATATTRTRCQALVGTDPGAELRRLHAVKTDRSGNQATVELRGTWVDSSGRQKFDSTVSVVDKDDQWRLVWNGTAVKAH